MNCDFVHDGLKYTIIKGNEVVIVGYNSMPSVLNIAPSFVEDEVEYVVVEIKESAFQGCMELTSIVIPKSITKIGVRAFKECKGLTTITLPDSIINIGEEAFKDCESLTKTIYEGDIQSWCKIQFGDGDSNPTTLSRNLYIDNKLLTELVIPNGVTHIGAFQFAGLSRLAMVTISDTVTSIGRETFEGCTSLTSVTIPNSVTSIGGYAFNGCTNLSIYIPFSVKEIGRDAFKDCKEVSCSVLFEISENKGKLVFLVIVLAIVFSIMFLLGI